MFVCCCSYLEAGCPPLPHLSNRTRQGWERLSLCWFGMFPPSMKVALGPVNSDILSETVGPAVPECPAGLLAWPCPRGVRASGGARPTVLGGLVCLLLRVSWSGTPHCLALHALQSILQFLKRCAEGSTREEFQGTVALRGLRPASLSSRGPGWVREGANLLGIAISGPAWLSRWA